MARRLVAFLVPTALALTAGPAQGQTPEPDPSMEVDMTLTGTRYSISYPPAFPGTTGNQETLSTSLAAFQSPLRDDDNPYSLQPFMQRESELTFTANGGRFDTANPYGGEDRTDWSAGVGGGFDLYAKRWLAVFAGASYTYFELQDVNLAQTIHSFGGDAGIGLRLRDTRIDVLGGEQVDRTFGAFGSWRYRLALSVFTVIRRRVSLGATGTLVHDGATGSIQVEVFPTKKAGVFATGFAGRFQPYVTPDIVKRYTGEVGFAGWIDATTAVVGRYLLTYEIDPGYHELSHTLQFGIFLRFS